MLGLVAKFIPFLSGVGKGFFSHLKDKSALKYQAQLSEAEWSRELARSTRNSWADEYVLLVITFPLIVRMAGTVWEGLTGDPLLSEAAGRLYEDVQFLLNGEYHTLLMTITLAVFGVRWHGKNQRRKILTNGKTVNGQTNTSPTSTDNDHHDRR